MPPCESAALRVHHTIIDITAIASRGLIAAYSVESRMHGRSGKHGGYRRCKEEGCEKVAKKGGLCIAHGRSRGRTRMKLDDADSDEVLQ